MRKIVLFIAFLFSIIVALPMGIVFSWNVICPQKPLLESKVIASDRIDDTHKNSQTTKQQTPNTSTSPTKKSSDYKDIEVSVYIVQTDKVVKMPLENYIKGVVAAEMPANFRPEALKAQAVASRTYAVSKLKEFGGTGQDHKGNAELCTDSHHCQAWASDAELKSKWGKDYNTNINKINKAVDDTLGEILVYQDKLIQPVFHAVSGGKTEDAKDVWGKSIPYLVSVDSPYEQASPKYKSRVTMAKSEFVRRLKALRPNGSVDINRLSSQVKVLSYSQTNRIKKIQVGDQILTGEEFRNVYGLNSTEVKITFAGNSIIMDVTGYGHGVGMSQYGANGMAQHGSNYQDILKHYYNGVSIIRLDELGKIR